MESRIRTVLVEDERKSLMTLETLLQRYCPEVEVVGTARSVEEAITVLHKEDPQLVFLDIAMPDGDAFDLLNRFGKVNFEIIFITAYNDYALKAFEFSALHYLLKPINYTDLQSAVHRYLRVRPDNHMQTRLDILSSSLNNQYDRISLPSNDGLVIVSIHEIIRIEAASNYSLVYLLTGESIVVSKAVSQFEEILQGLHFARIHNTHLINLKYLKRYQRGQGGMVTLTDGSQIAVSKSRKNQFLDLLKELSLTLGKPTT
jgi:two-component system LytT family response regulator